MSSPGIIGSRLENNNVYCKEIKGKLKYICKEWKTIRGDLVDLKENKMFLLEIKNPVLKLKPQWVDLAALIKCF